MPPIGRASADRSYEAFMSKSSDMREHCDKEINSA